MAQQYQSHKRSSRVCTRFCSCLRSALISSAIKSCRSTTWCTRAVMCCCWTCHVAHHGQHELAWMNQQSFPVIPSALAVRVNSTFPSRCFAELRGRQFKPVAFPNIAPHEKLPMAAYLPFMVHMWTTRAKPLSQLFAAQSPVRNPTCSPGIGSTCRGVGLRCPPAGHAALLPLPRCAS